METTSILIKLRKIIRSIHLESKKIQKEYGISIPQVLCLSYLQECPNYQSTQNDVRKFLHLNASTASGIINRLEKKGLIARLPKSADKRITNIALTARGYALITNIPPLLHDQLTGKLKDEPQTEINQIIHTLDTLIHLLGIEEVQATPIITSADDLNNNSDI